MPTFSCDRRDDCRPKLGPRRDRTPTASEGQLGGVAGGHFLVQQRGRNERLRLRSPYGVHGSGSPVTKPARPNDWDELAARLLAHADAGTTDSAEGSCTVSVTDYADPTR